MNYAAATNWLSSRSNLPTVMGSAELGVNLDAAVKARSFFSAKVAEAHILDKLRDVSDRFSRGELDRTSARAELKSWLSGRGYQPDDVAAVPPDGVKRKDWDRNNAITNLASTARLDLILDQNSRMAAAVGQYQAGMDPDIAERWPNWRYITGPNPRDEHAKLNGFVAKKTDPVWSKIFPPWAFRCNCSVEDCDDEEAADYGGVKESVKGKIDHNGFIDLSKPSPDGYEFNPAEAMHTIDTSIIKDPGLRLEAVEQTEIAFGDQVQRQDDGNLKVMPLQQEYATWEDKGLDSAKTWKSLPVPSEIAPDKARAMLKKGIELTAGDGSSVTLGKEVLAHWEIEKGKLPQDIDGRLSRLNTAIDTVKTPHEVWHQDTQRRYLQKFQKVTGGFEGCLVAVTNDNQAKTYFIRSVTGIDNARNGVSFEEF